MIFDVEKYTLITYRTVSEDAIINDAQSPSSESAPNLFNIPSKIAREAPPDKGLTIISGKIPEGIFKNSKTGESSLDIKSLAPDASKIDTPTTKAQSVGSSLQALEIPSLAPSKKEEKYSFLPSKIISEKTKIIMGIKEEEMRFRRLNILLSSCCRKLRKKS